jgi:hypothetical protein
MRARIIFQGLTVFTHGRPTADAENGERKLGPLTAWLVSDPMHHAAPLHTHRPYLGFIGLDARTNESRVETKHWIPFDTTIRLDDPSLTPGVVIDQSYLDYVPRLGALHPSDTRSFTSILQNLQQSGLISSRITIPSGTIRARNFITWDWHGNTPTRVAYMDTNIQGFASNEVVVDIGDDSDINDDHCKGCLVVEGVGLNRVQQQVEPRHSYEFRAELCPRVRTPTDYDIDPNTVELLITNLPARRPRALFYGLHAEVASEAAGFARRDYKTTPQYERFAAVADEYDHNQWMVDEPMIMGHPFPFLIDPSEDKLDGLKDVGERGMAVRPPDPYGRPQGVIRPGAVGGDLPDHTPHVDSPTGDDPQNTEICPFTRI